MARLQPLITMFVGLGLFLQVTARTQTQENPTKPAAPPMELTALDYIQIQQLVPSTPNISTCSNNGYDYADLFTRRFFAPLRMDRSAGSRRPRRWRGCRRRTEWLHGRRLIVRA